MNLGGFLENLRTFHELGWVLENLRAFEYLIFKKEKRPVRTLTACQGNLISTTQS